MFVRRHWDVLLVDDEPDVLQISKLAMKNIECYGIPIKVHTAASKAEAISFLTSKQGQVPDLAMAIIDVVMESEMAGLELCQFIREELRNNVTQLYVRTGQAGKAPERKVIDKYDISGYVTKVEATEDRLYTMTKSGVRDFLWGRLLYGMLSNDSRIVASATSEEALLGEFKRICTAATQDTKGGQLPAVEKHATYYFGDREISIGDLGGDKAAMLRKQLSTMPTTQLNADGDTMQRDGEHVYLRIKTDASGLDVGVVARTSFNPMPDFYSITWCHWMRTIRGALQLARR